MCVTCDLKSKFKNENMKAKMHNLRKNCTWTLCGSALFKQCIFA